MVAKISTGVRRAATAYGLSVSATSALGELIASKKGQHLDEQVEADSEKFWEPSGSIGAAASMPDSDTLREAIEDTCDELDVARIVLLVDEAAHVFIPGQQRQFFTLMRDLRSPRISVKAAVYPGATAYGESFQPSHDATVMDVERSVADIGYAEAMREIVLKQEPSLRKSLETSGEAFDVLAYAATGNPRIF